VAVDHFRRGERLDARRVNITRDVLAGLLADLPRDTNDRPRLPSADFDGAQFSGEANFCGAYFSGEVSFRGARFSSEVSFAEARFAALANFSGAQFSGGADFRGAQFAGPAGFNKTQFAGQASFDETRFADWAGFVDAQFAGEANFRGAQFASHAGFDAAQFSETTSFRGARFSGYARFVSTRFSGQATFDRAQFLDDTRFHEARFSSAVTFSRAQFSDWAGFGDVQFCGAAFHGARFSGKTDFDGTTFSGDAYFVDSRFVGDADFGLMVVVGTLDCDGAVFGSDLRVQLIACGLSCRKTRFEGRADLDVRWAEVALDEAMFVGRSRLWGVGSWPELDERAVHDRRGDAYYADRAGIADRLDVQERPRLLSLRRANVENLTLGNLDLRACRFSGAHGLDNLRIEADCEFPAPPGRWRTRRRTLVEEHDWRANRHSAARIPDDASRVARSPRESAHTPTTPHGRGWLPAECQPAAWLEQDSRAEVLEPPRIASLYRALRKALEDRNDEPGAGDFYYGEMEMRRQRQAHASQHEWRLMPDRGERAILTLYWLVSGYGMRASRALAFLTVTVAVGALLLEHDGFRGAQPAGGPIAFAMESAISLLRAPTVTLTPNGEFVQIALRLLGPLFLGLALLALRGRVKR
jgi:uncharacterized protein YjbI with pentapeptide repeats